MTDAVSAHKGEDARVPCFNSTVMDPKSGYRVRLVKYATDASQIVMFAWPNNNQDAKRVKWSRDGIESLRLMNVTKSDEGLYSCEVCQGWECMLVKYISLKVKGKITHFLLPVLLVHPTCLLHHSFQLCCSFRLQSLESNEGETEHRHSAELFI